MRNFKGVETHDKYESFRRITNKGRINKLF